MTMIKHLEWETDPKTGEKFVSVPDVCGSFWWAQLHSWAENVRDSGCASCGAFAVMAATAIHDMVNNHVGKPIQDPQNLMSFAEKMLGTLDSISQHDHGTAGQAQDADVCELVPPGQGFAASMFTPDPAMIEG